MSQKSSLTQSDHSVRQALTAYTTAIWLNGYYHGRVGSTTIDTEQSEAIFGVLMDYCRTGENGKVLVMQALERLMKPK